MSSLVTQVKHSLENVWESLHEGWRELGERAGGAMTRFMRVRPDPVADDDLPPMMNWALLATDVFDDDDRIVVRLEAPGMKRDDFQIEVQGELLTVRGEKRFEREGEKGSYRLFQCAYGNFRRDVPLPVRVRAEKAKASYRDGVLRIELPKAEGSRVRRIPVALG